MEARKLPIPEVQRKRVATVLRRSKRSTTLTSQTTIAAFIENYLKPFNHKVQDSEQTERSRISNEESATRQKNSIFTDSLIFIPAIVDSRQMIASIILPSEIQQGGFSKVVTGERKSPRYSCDELWIRVRPVSYTHLDVYKRQLYFNRTSPKTIGLENSKI